MATALTDFYSQNYYNNEISLYEIESAIHKLKLTSPGIDMVHNNFLKNISHEYLTFFFKICIIMFSTLLSSLSPGKQS